MVIPDTGLFELPTRPTILELTALKKKPNITTSIAPATVTGIAGMSQIMMMRTAIEIRTKRISRSISVRSVEVLFLLLFETPFREAENALTIVGNVLIRLMIPAAATAPAPMYLMKLDQIAEAPPVAYSSATETDAG